MENKNTQDVLNSFPVSQEQINQAYGVFVDTINKRSVRYLNTQKNANTLRDNIVKTSGTPGLLFAGSWLEAWAQASAEDLLEEPLTEKEKEARRLQRVAELEARDRRDGLNPHVNEAEQEEQRQKAIEEHNKNVEAGKKRLEEARNAVLNPTADPTTADALADLRNRGFERGQIVSWLKSWKPELIRSVRKMNPDLAVRIDAIVAGRPDPGAAV
jgi:hypothetical protein